MKRFNQKGLAQIVIIGLILMVLLAAAATLTFMGLKTVKPQNSKTQTPSQTTLKQGAQQKCTSTDYGGCDSEKNFYQWKDDGLRK